MPDLTVSAYLRSVADLLEAAEAIIDGLTDGQPAALPQLALPPAPQKALITPQEGSGSICLAAGCGRAFKSTRALAAHLANVSASHRRQHYDARGYPAVVSRPRKTNRRGSAQGQYPCGIDGCSFVALAATGLGAHKRSKHGIAGAGRLKAVG